MKKIIALLLLSFPLLNQAMTIQSVWPITQDQAEQFIPMMPQPLLIYVSDESTDVSSSTIAIFTQSAAELTGKYVCVSLDCGKAEEFCKKNTIERYPAILLFRSGKKIDTFYECSSKESFLAQLTSKKLDFATLTKAERLEHFKIALADLNQEVIAELLTFDISPNEDMKDENQPTPLSILIHLLPLKGTAVMPCMNYLIEAGADVDYIFVENGKEYSYSDLIPIGVASFKNIITNADLVINFLDKNSEKPTAIPGTLVCDGDVCYIQK